MNKEKKIEFGDFQTPKMLSDKVCDVLAGLGLNPEIIIEPTCGKGNFLFSSLEKFLKVKKIICNEINLQYINEIKRTSTFLENKSKINLKNFDFFKIDWASLIKNEKRTIAFIGNPPWVTNSKVGALKGANLPIKTNFKNMKGMEALMGGSNFDISEWMLITMINALANKKGYIAMLVKTIVARNTLLYIWKNKLQLTRSHIYEINTNQNFGVSVDACLFFCEFGDSNICDSAQVYSSIDSQNVEKSIGFRDGRLIADIDAYKEVASLIGGEVKWRSGVKHDCSKVMELQKVNKCYVNGFGDLVDIEEEYLFPMMKSSDLANGRMITRWMIVTQKEIKEDTDKIRNRAPKTWNYLMRNSDSLGKRGSSIYKDNAKFSMFGVGEYTFSNWKVAISGLYKNYEFRLVGPYHQKPVVFDDTCYFLACSSKANAIKIHKMLNSRIGKLFLKSFVFNDSKRPITTKILNLLNIEKALSKYEKLIKL